MIFLVSGGERLARAFVGGHRYKKNYHVKNYQPKKKDMSTAQPLFVRQSKGCNLVHVEEAAKALSVSPGDILQWIFTFDEHSCAMLRTKDGLFVEVEGITRIAARRCEHRQVQAWKREISPRTAVY